jgi:hypothetical protein
MQGEVMKRPRICGHCRASCITNHHAICMLGHKVKTINKPTTIGPMLTRGVPQEPCEKPTTYAEYIRLRQEKETS